MYFFASFFSNDNDLLQRIVMKKEKKKADLKIQISAFNLI